VRQSESFFLIVWVPKLLVAVHRYGIKRTFLDIAQDRADCATAKDRLNWKSNLAEVVAESR
jgi:hypothetical protein